MLQGVACTTTRSPAPCGIRHRKGRPARYRLSASDIWVAAHPMASVTESGAEVSHSSVLPRIAGAADEFNTFCRPGAAKGEVSGDDDLRGTQPVQVLQDRLQCPEVAMNIGNHRNHGGDSPNTASMKLFMMRAVTPQISYRPCV